MQELDSSADFDATRDREFFAALPARAAVFAIDRARGTNGGAALPAAHGKFAAASRETAGPAEPASKRLNLREFAARVRYRHSPAHLLN